MSQSNYIKKYLDFHDQITERFSDSKESLLLWSSTWACSRNRFLSPLRPILEAAWRGEELPKTSGLFRKLYNFAKSIRAFLLVSYQIIRTRYRLRSVLEPRFAKLAGKDVFLVRSFAYGKSFQGSKYDDAFWKSLPSFLENTGKPVIIVHEPIHCFSESLDFAENNEVLVVPYYYFLRISDLALALLRQLFTAEPHFESMRFATKSGGTVNVGRETASAISADILDASTFYGLIFYPMFARIAGQFSIARYFLTFEGNPWEKTSILGLREVSTEIKTTGYQHAVVPESAAGVFLHRREHELLAFPDKILTVGAIPRDIIRSHSSIESSRVEAGCALRYEYLQSIEGKTSPIPKKLLIALEGVKFTCKLLDYVARSEGLEDWEITIRCHPAYPFEVMQKDYDFRADFLKRIKVSDSTLPEDLEEAGVVLYWGSTVSLEALQQGIPVIHLQGDEVLSYDPLFQCDVLHETVTAEDSLKCVLEKYTSLSQDELSSRREEARKYIQSYFHPATEERVANFVE